MNAGAEANRMKAEETASLIAVWRSEGLTYSTIGKRLDISPEACKQRLYRFRKHAEGTDGSING